MSYPTVAVIRNVSKGTQGHPNSQTEDNECRMEVTSGTSAGKKRASTDGKSKRTGPEINTR